MTFISETSPREELEAAAREAGLPLVDDNRALYESIQAWIESGDECADA